MTQAEQKGGRLNTVLESAQAGTRADAPAGGPRLTAVLATPGQFDLVYGFFGEVRAWHLATKPEAWPVFSPDAIREDIAQGRVFLFHEGGEVLATLTFTESDPLVWGDDGVPPLAYYIHRLASRRDRPGQGLGARALAWAKEHSRAQGKTFLRLDTWASNLRLKAYYEANGYTLVRKVSFPEDTPLPAHYRGASMHLFEMRL